MGEWDGERVPGASVRECGIVRVGERESGRVREWGSARIRAGSWGSGKSASVGEWERLNHCK